MANLVFQANGQKKTLSCIEDRPLNCPYIVVNQTGYIPLTTDTHSGIKVNISGIDFSPMQTVATTKSTTISQSYTYHCGDIGRTQSISFTMNSQDREMYATGGTIKTGYRDTYGSYEQSYIVYNNYSKLLGRWTKVAEYANDTAWENMSKGEYYYANRESETFSFLSANYCGMFLGNSLYVKRNSAVESIPFMMLSTSLSTKSGTGSNYWGKDNTVTSSTHHYYASLRTYTNANSSLVLNWYKDDNKVSLPATSRYLRIYSTVTSASGSLTYMTNQKESFTHYGFTTNRGDQTKTVTVSYIPNTSDTYGLSFGTYITSRFVSGSNGYNYNAPINIDAYTTNGNFTLTISGVSSNNYTSSITIATSRLECNITYGLYKISDTNIIKYYNNFNYDNYCSKGEVFNNATLSLNNMYSLSQSGTKSGFSGTIQKITMSPSGTLIGNAIVPSAGKAYRTNYYERNKYLYSKPFNTSSTSFNNTNSTYFVDTANTSSNVYTYTAITTTARTIYN